MASVLVTGASGYIGGHLVRYLEAEGRWAIRAAFRNVPAGGVTSGAACPFDLFDSAVLNAACAGVDAVIHLAALNDADCRRYPEEAFRVNCAGTHNLVEAARRAGVKRFIYASTAHVYGTPLEGAIDESRLPRPVSIYALTHKCAEDVVLAAAPGMQSMVLRLSNGFGAPSTPEVNAWMLLANDLCRQAVERRKLVLQSPGLQWRDFITMTDVVRGFAHALDVPDGAANGILNLGGENVMRVIDFCALVQKVSERLLGEPLSVERPAVPIGSASPDSFSYSVERLKATGFTLVGDIEGELEHLLRYCRTHFQ